LTIDATLLALMPLAKQYLDSSHTESRFWPLLELQPQQQSAIFSRVTMEASLIMCSQLAADLRDKLAGVKATPQYTQALSRARTSCSSHAGIFQLFATADPGYVTHNSLKKVHSAFLS
jgi:hypothetical protein